MLMLKWSLVAVFSLLKVAVVSGMIEAKKYSPSSGASISIFYCTKLFYFGADNYFIDARVIGFFCMGVSIASGIISTEYRVEPV